MEIMTGEFNRADQLVNSIFILFIALVFSGIASIPLFFIISDKRLHALLPKESWRYVRKRQGILFLIYFVLFSVLITADSLDFDINAYIALLILLGMYYLAGLFVWRRELFSTKQRYFD
jgi:O-antigen/teichoic acid export membrane protein